MIKGTKKTPELKYKSHFRRLVLHIINKELVYRIYKELQSIEKQPINQKKEKGEKI
jgi:hypothetical protein